MESFHCVIKSLIDLLQALTPGPFNQPLCLDLQARALSANKGGLGCLLPGKARGMGTDSGFPVGIFLKDWDDFILLLGGLCRSLSHPPDPSQPSPALSICCGAFTRQQTQVSSLPSLPSAFLLFPPMKPGWTLGCWGTERWVSRRSGEGRRRTGYFSITAINSTSFQFNSVFI